jgi:hypothetical protein
MRPNPPSSLAPGQTNKKLDDPPFPLKNRKENLIMLRSGKIIIWILIILGVGVAVAAFVAYEIYFHANYYVVEYNEYRDPPPKEDPELTDDSLEEKHPVFKEQLIDSRPLGDWELNASAAVISLDCPKIKPEQDDELLELNATYSRAIGKANKLHKTMLPSANLLDGAAKQFDDGLYAAVDLECFRGKLGFAVSAPQFVESLFLALPTNSPARPFLAGALELAGKPQKLSAEEERQKAKFLADFDGDLVRSKPISFYMSPELKRTWKFFRYLQWDFVNPPDQTIPNALSAALKQNENLLPPYRSIYSFYVRLTNPPLPRLQPLIDFTDADQNASPATANSRAADFTRTVFPPSTSRETELFERLFDNGIPNSANLISELIRRIRSGDIDLKPRENDGWYQYQAYALESMLLPVKSQENEKLLLSAAYKKRLVETFKALLTKRRETHARQLAMAKCAAEAPLREAQVCPRLRIEPCTTFYLRTARAYAFLQNLLQATVGEKILSQLRGLSPWGRRELNLAVELESMRLRFYGFYLLSCEDLGMEPQLLPDEPVDKAAALNAALKWLALLESPDLHVDVPEMTADTRMSIPIAYDPMRNVTRLWATLGVRLIPLKAEYARPPKVRPKEKGGDWTDPPPHTLGSSEYVLAVDEFAEFELPGSASLTREEFQEICEKNQRDKEKILQALKASR